MYTILERKKKCVLPKKKYKTRSLYMYKTREATKRTGNNSHMSNQKFTICTHGTEQGKKKRLTVQ